MINWTLCFTLLGAISASYHLCRFIFWLDDPCRR